MRIVWCLPWLLVACAEPRMPDFVPLVEDAAPAVVNISGSSGPSDATASHPFGDWFRDFFQTPDSQQQQRESQSLGSGFVIDAGGEILTNYHVVRNAQEIVVRLADRRQFTAQLVGADERSDLALLKIEAEDLPVLEFGQSAELRVGEWVLAIGSPFGFELSVTAGIVSATGRALQGEQYVPFIQTDVAINPGNSGGPLFNLDGEVVGVNSQIYSQTGGYMGLSFAIPIDTAVRVVDQLRRYGEVRRGWLGVVIQEVDRGLAASFGLDKAEGALVSQVVADSPAAQGGIQVGDIILSVDGVAVEESRTLPPLIGSLTPGDKVSLRILRDGRRQRLRLMLGSLSGDANPLAAQIDRLGLELRDPRKAELAEHALDGGAVVVSLDAGAGRASGLQVGDLIAALDGEPVRNVAHFRELAGRLGMGESAPLLVYRGSRSLFLALNMESR